ncbi:MAG: hybrid sensor histidine kinase/response regulator [Desulfobacterales bacterium]|nr:hybrid sensor histidine kinase/response regulator [Desulfobacterales bacterium]
MDSQAHTLLLVDDEEGIRNVLDITLSHAGYQVLTAPDGETAMGIFQDAEPEIVISDIKMPGIDGIELLQRIKSRAPETEVIMITGHGDMELAVKSLQHEATDFITKPIDSRELELSVEKAVDRITINRRIRQYMAELEDTVKEQDRTIDETRALGTIGQTVAGMSHVIKNIAGGLKGSSFILEQGIENENREYLVKGWEMMKGNIDKITRLSLDLLNYAKTGQLRFEPVSLPTLVTEAGNLLAPRFKEAGIEFISTLASGVGQIQVNGDREALLACLLNLLDNAVDALAPREFDAKGNMESRARQIALELEGQGDGICLTVRDTGAGMPGDIQKRIFKEFITTKGTRGTGFGLMTSWKIISEHQGELSFSSKEGEGTQFRIFLPRDAGGQVSPKHKDVT